jgi:hypothetical protein
MPVVLKFARARKDRALRRARWFALSVLLAAAFAVSGLGYLPRAHADGMRCGTQLVSDGDPMYEVRNLCGAPDQASQRTERRVVSRAVQGVCYNRGQPYTCATVIQEAIEVVLDEWFYDFGRAVLVRTVVFEGGRLVKVVTGGYGTKDT